MHEMALTRDLVSLIADHCAGRRVTRVVLEVGKLRTAFAHAKPKTVLQPTAGRIGSRGKPAPAEFGEPRIR